VHRRSSLIEEVLVYSPHPATLGQIAQGAAATSFELESNYNDFNDTLHHGGYYATTDLLADVNGDALPDLVIAPEYNDQYNLAVTALINQGGGRFAVQDPVQINSAQNAFGLGLLSAGSLPSILGVGQQPDDFHENLSTF